MADVTAKPDASVKILKYKQQLEDIQQTLDRKNAKPNRKSIKVSPKKQRLREQLKQQLATQQKLLQVQQEIFEKTSKAQQDIFNLISKLGEDDDDSFEDDEDELAGYNKEAAAREIEMANVKFEDRLNQSEMCIEDPNMNKLIVADTVNESYEYFQPENYGLEEQYIADEDGNITILNAAPSSSSSTITSGGKNAQSTAVRVVVRSDDGEEEYELIEVEEQMCEADETGIGENGINFEVIGQDTNSMHCRIVSNENAMVQEIEYIDVQASSRKSFRMLNQPKITNLNVRFAMNSCPTGTASGRIYSGCIRNKRIKFVNIAIDHLRARAI